MTEPIGGKGVPFGGGGEGVEMVHGERLSVNPPFNRRPPWAQGGASFPHNGGGRLAGQWTRLMRLCGLQLSSGRLSGSYWGPGRGFFSGMGHSWGVTAEMGGRYP